MTPWQETRGQEYRMAKGWRIFLGVLLPPLALLFLALPFLLMRGKNPSLATGVGVGLLGVGLAGFMVYVLLDVMKSRFVIGLREVSQVGVFNTKTLTLPEIDGYRVDDKYTHIYPKEKYLPTLKIATATERYHEIGQWLAARYPDLDQQETQQATAALLADTALGDTPAARAQALAVAQNVALGLNIVGGAVGGWLLLYPQPLQWAVGAGLLLPLLATAALWLLPNILRIDKKKNSGHPSVLWAFAAPSFGLLLRALFDYDLVRYAPLWPLAGMAAAGMTMLLIVGSRRFLFGAGSAGGLGVAILLLALLYGYGAASTINAVYDESPATVFRPQVVSKHINSGKTKTYYLTLHAWGPVATEEDVKVSRIYYQQVQPGQQVAVALRPGRLGVPWFAVLE